MYTNVAAVSAVAPYTIEILQEFPCQDRLSGMSMMKAADTDQFSTRNGQLASDEVADNLATSCSDVVPACLPAADVLPEEEEEEGRDAATVFNPLPAPPEYPYSWRINLALTEPFWKEWFSGLSTLFLECSVPKLLLLAGVDRLDRTLTTGQMQGRFQMLVLPQAGHAVHEDLPDHVAEATAGFLVRHRIALPTDQFRW